MQPAFEPCAPHSGRCSLLLNRPLVLDHNDAAVCLHGRLSQRQDVRWCRGVSSFIDGRHGDASSTATGRMAARMRSTLVCTLPLSAASALCTSPVL